MKKLRMKAVVKQGELLSRKMGVILQQMDELCKVLEARQEGAVNPTLRKLQEAVSDMKGLRQSLAEAFAFIARLDGDDVSELLERWKIRASALSQVVALLDRAPSKKPKDVKQNQDKGVWYPQMTRDQMDRPPDTTGDI